MKLDAKAAADKIRPLWDKFPAPVSADEQHQIAFLTSVCQHLGVEPNQINIVHVQSLLTKEHIDRHVAEPYPKMLSTKDEHNRLVPLMWPEDHPTRANTPVVFDSEEEEAFYNAHDKKALSQDELDTINAEDNPTPPASGAGDPPVVTKPPVVPPSPMAPPVGH